MTSDPIINEIRRAGKEMAEEAGYDIHRLCENLRKNEKLSGVVVVDSIIKSSG